MNVIIIDLDVREEISVHLFEDYEIESNKVINLTQTEREYEWYNSLSKGLYSGEPEYCTSPYS